MFYLSTFCLGVLAACLVLMFVCFAYVILLDVFGEWESKAADAAWDLMKWSGFIALGAIGLLILGWIICGVILIFTLF